MILSPPLFSELDPEFKSVLGVPTVTPVLFSLTTDFIICCCSESPSCLLSS